MPFDLHAGTLPADEESQRGPASPPPSPAARVFGYGIVDATDQPWWLTRTGIWVGVDADPMGWVCMALNSAKGDRRQPYRVVRLLFEEIEDDA